MMTLSAAGEGHKALLSILLNNRAACHLKNGTSQACVADCTYSLHLVPINVKALVRRAQAYEAMDKSDLSLIPSCVHLCVYVCRYRLAYVDNQMALNIDRSLDTVYAANSRLRKLLEDQDGHHWRDKLPQHPQHDSIMQALRQRSYNMGPNTNARNMTISDTETSRNMESADSGEVGVTASASSAPPPSLSTSTARTPADLKTNVSQF